jgi:hypothetical protein
VGAASKRKRLLALKKSFTKTGTVTFLLVRKRAHKNGSVRIIRNAADTQRSTLGLVSDKTLDGPVHFHLKITGDETTRLLQYVDIGQRKKGQTQSGNLAVARRFKVVLQACLFNGIRLDNTSVNWARHGDTATKSHSLREKSR